MRTRHACGVRVTGGRLGGRRLVAPRGARTRPTSDRVRESLFAVLGPLDGARVLDLFAGSGALGLEALSRGAARATFVDSAPAALVVCESDRRAPLSLELHLRDERRYGDTLIRIHDTR